MPRFAWILLAACSINADYSKAHVRCSNGQCPTGQTCFATGFCGFGDASGGGSDAKVVDARQPALTCNDPGDALGTHSGSAGSANHVSAMCGTAVYNGPDAVYMLTGPRSISITITGNYAVAAYVVASCPAVTCEGGSAASPTLTTSIGSGTHFIVVDGVNPALSGNYTLEVH